MIFNAHFWNAGARSYNPICLNPLLVLEKITPLPGSSDNLSLYIICLIQIQIKKKEAEKNILILFVSESRLVEMFSAKSISSYCLFIENNLWLQIHLTSDLYIFYLMVNICITMLNVIMYFHIINILNSLNYSTLYILYL